MHEHRCGTTRYYTVVVGRPTKRQAGHGSRELIECDMTRRHRQHISPTGCPWTLPLADALGPPVEEGRRADEIGAGLQGDAAFRLGILQLLDARKMPVDQHRVRQWPQMLSRLQFRGMGRQEQQVDMLRHPHSGTVVPTGAVQYEHDPFRRTGTDLVGERVEFHREELDVHGCRQMPHRAPRGRLHEADDVSPLIAVLDGSDGSDGTLAR